MLYCLTCLWYNDNGTCERGGNTSELICSAGYRFNDPESQRQKRLRELYLEVEKQANIIKELTAKLKESDNGKT